MTYPTCRSGSRMPESAHEGVIFREFVLTFLLSGSVDDLEVKIPEMLNFSLNHVVVDL